MKRLAIWVAMLGASGAVLWMVPTPVPDLSLDGFSSWFATARPDEVAVVMVRLMAALWWFRAATNTAYLLAAGLVEAQDHVDKAIAQLPGIGQRLVRPMAIGVAVTTFAATAPAMAQEAPELPEPTPSTSTSTAEPAPPELVMTRLSDDGWPDYFYPIATTDLSPDVAQVEPENTATSDNGAAIDQTWVVARGDHLWSIAQRTAPAGATIGEVGQHWLAIIELNTPNLPDPHNPDLIYPGNIIELPAV